ncbi:DUF3307 domain-containing protein [Haloferula sp.]|uniref:DUF3307 domain-containing protein n=1 Tax=Haloferula sp. TaxID=2497595 RepID=UPI0032A13051
MDFTPIAFLDISHQGWMGGFVVLFALVIGHAVADFALQGDFLAIAKNRHANLDRFFGKDGAPPHVWVWALGAHSLIHAGAVWFITGSVVLGAAELVLHWVIDYAKSEGHTNFSIDQLLHLVCKLIYSLLIAMGVGWVYWTP